MNKSTLGMLGVVTAGLAICPLCKPEAYAASSVLHPAALFMSATDTLQVETVTLRVEGMTCGGCVLGTKKVLTKLDGVTKAEVSYENKQAVVTYDPKKVTVEQMIAAIKTLGYIATKVVS